MKPGKKICETLKAIRSDIARANDIDYTPTPCDHQGDCAGTCPACESEMRWIERQLRVRKALGKAVTIASVSMALSLGASAATPSSNGVDQKRKTEPPSRPVNPDRTRTAGVVRRPPVNEEEETRKKAEEERMRKMLEEQRKQNVRGKIPMPPETPKNDSISNVLKNGSQFVAEGDTIITEDGNEVVVRELTTGIVAAPPKLVKDYIYSEVDVEARFPGGDQAMDSLIRDQLYIPDEILEPIKEMGGTVKARCIVKALVERDGTISDAVIEKTTTSPIFDNEALQVVKNLPPFTPARLYGATVRSWKLIPVEFIYDFSNPKQTSEQGDEQTRQ